MARNDRGHQADVVGLAVGIGGHRHGQPFRRQVSHQGLPPTTLPALLRTGLSRLATFLSCLPSRMVTLISARDAGMRATWAFSGINGPMSSVMFSKKPRLKGIGSRRSLP